MKIKINELSVSAFFRISEILDSDQYELIKKGRRYVNGDKIPKNERTPEFIFELYRKIVGELSGLSVQYLQDDTFIQIVIDQITEKFAPLKSILSTEQDISLISKDEFSLKVDKDGQDCISVLKFTPFSEWTFNKWVTLENALKGQQEEIDGEIKTIERGEKFILPVTFGEWFDNMPLLGEKFHLFNNELLAKDVLPVLVRVNSLINKLKESYRFIYKTSSEDEEKEQNKSGKAFKLHAEMFGWQETLRDLAEKRVFGNYIETKNAPMLQVLEYLNCSISKEVAREEDFLTKHKQK